MKSIILKYGILSGIATSLFMLFYYTKFYANQDFFGPHCILAFGALLLCHIFIFLGVMEFRDKKNNFTISFKKALQIGLSITILATIIYGFFCVANYYFASPNFVDSYLKYQLREDRVIHLSEEKNLKLKSSIDEYKTYNSNPFHLFIKNSLDIVFYGVFISFVSAFLLKRKQLI